MTDDILNPETIRADMEAGTPGPWTWEKPKNWPDYEYTQGYLGGFWGTGDLGHEPCIMTFGNNTAYYPSEGDPPNEANARRIARLPDLEQAYLDAIARAESAEAERDRLRGLLIEAAPALEATGVNVSLAKDMRAALMDGEAE